MNNEKLITLKLIPNDMGQLLDGIIVRRDDWRYTQRYFEEGYEETDRIIEECDDANEARCIADHYEEIINEIEKQWNEQKAKLRV